MIISHSLKLIFVHVHRTGGTSLSEVLKSYSKGNVQVLVQHDNAQSSAAPYFKQYPDYFTFGFARNPWDRIASWYFLLHRADPKSLEEEQRRLEQFIESDAMLDSSTNWFHYNSIDYFTLKNGERADKAIYKFEDFEKEAERLFATIDIPSTEIPKHNRGNIINYRIYYTDKSKQMIAEKCSKDIVYFDYHF